MSSGLGLCYVWERESPRGTWGPDTSSRKLPSRAPGNPGPPGGPQQSPRPLPPPSFSFWCAFLRISSQSKLLNIAEVKSNSIQVIKKKKLLLELGVFTDCFLPSEILSSYFPYPLGHVSFSPRKQLCIFFLITLGSFGMWLRIREAVVSVITQNTWGKWDGCSMLTSACLRVFSSGATVTGQNV